jgi:hypothetical protein
VDDWLSGEGILVFGKETGIQRRGFPSMPASQRVAMAKLTYSLSNMNKCSFVSSLTCPFQLARIEPSSAERQAVYLVDALILLGLIGL